MKLIRTVVFILFALPILLQAQPPTTTIEEKKQVTTTPTGKIAVTPTIISVIYINGIKQNGYVYANETKTFSRKAGTYNVKAVYAWDDDLYLEKEVVVKTNNTSYCNLDVKKVVDNANKAKVTYSAAPATGSGVLLNEDFSTQTTRFLSPGDYTYSTVAIKDGYYSYKNKSTTGYIHTAKELPDFNENKDFIVSCQVFISGTSSSGVGIDWGMQGDADKYFRFEILKNPSNELKFTIYRYDGEVTNLKDFTLSSAISEKEWNTLTVRKIKNTYNFYINGTLVHTADFQPLFGKKFGIKIPVNYTGYFDDFIVSYLN